MSRDLEEEHLRAMLVLDLMGHLDRLGVEAVLGALHDSCVAKGEELSKQLADTLDQLAADVRELRKLRGE